MTFQSRPDRVRAHSDQQQNQHSDAQTQQCLERYATAERDAISRHLEELDREWDVERYLQMNAGLVSLSGVVLGALVDRRFADPELRSSLTSKISRISV